MPFVYHEPPIHVKDEGDLMRAQARIDVLRRTRAAYDRALARGTCVADLVSGAMRPMTEGERAELQCRRDVTAISERAQQEEIERYERARPLMVHPDFAFPQYYFARKHA